ncbi:DoxX family membrane protein [Parabacteroides sp. OttesenSCG-928-G07]|nr:DoxX family membrane protein [Parabacteroides sp. OttesenSCG-928-G21]MDL2278818.1 DoxX family membrane protein [Parabacteroides sp. OttesenSCG-928-G07]
MNTETYSKSQISWLMILRLFIGWHFMFEGITKIINPSWTALPYLLDSQGPFSSWFISMTQNPGLMSFVDLANQWGLLLIGLALTLGVFFRLASYGGILLLIMYTMSHPALLSVNYMMAFEGTYLFIDKNVVEIAALGVLCVFPTSRVIGFDSLLARWCPALVKYKLI